jgi:integrase
MGRKTYPGPIKRNGVWHIDKKICGRRVCQSTGTGCPQEAERYLARVMEEMRQATVYGVRPIRTFEEAAAKFVIENQHKRSIGDGIMHLKHLMPWIGELPVDRIHRGSLDPWVAHRRDQGRAVGTINHGLKVVRRILNVAASEWVDESGLTWLQNAPKIKLIPDTKKRQPYPLSWEEQAALFRELPDHLAEMALFAVNTVCRDREICNLRWDFEDRQDLLGHKSGRITTHYSAAELSRLIDAAEAVTDRNGTRPELVVLRGTGHAKSRKTPASFKPA